MTADSCPHCYAPVRAGRASCACGARATTTGRATGPVLGVHSAQTTDDQTTDARATGGRAARRAARTAQADGQPRAVRPYLRLSGDRSGGPRPRDVGKFFRKAKAEAEPGPAEAAAAEAGPQHGQGPTSQPGAQFGPQSAARPGAEGNAADETQVIDRIAPITPVDRITPGGPVDRTRVIDRITAAGRRDSDAPGAAGDGVEAAAFKGAGRGGGTDRPHDETLSSADDDGGRHRKNRRKPVATAVAGAAAVVVAGTLAFTTGLLGGNRDSGKRGDGALADTQTSTPDLPPAEDEGATPPSSSPPTKKKKPSSPPSPAKPPSTSRSQNRVAPPAPTTPAAPPTTNRPTTPQTPEDPGTPSTPEKTKEPTKPPTSEPPKTPEPTGPPVLSEGDSGAEVEELQKRLTQLLMYIGIADGKYDDGLKDAVAAYQDRYGIEDDPEGVYGENTRLDLESRTDEP
ncbi:peptidoglycan-binding protein [Streptomyces sp. NPDC059850]|uniref:peptidoglycan-binding domain-containing protein n=1 Tax=Streptomyces sp. NPDC059850 TaxID=3346970 RepID=UPI003661C497